MRRTVIALLIPLALLGVACGGDDDPTVQGSPPATVETPEPTDEPTQSPTEECVDQTDQGQIEVEMYDNFFEPACLTVSEDQPSQILNEGDAAHTFTIPETQVDVELDPGERFGGEGFGLPAGEYVYYCRFHGSPAGSGMAGTMTIE